MMRKRHSIRSRDEAAPATGRHVPPRKLLKKAGNVEMWQVEVRGQSWRNASALRYEIVGGPGPTAVFSRPHEAFAYFQRIVPARHAGGS